MIRVEQLTKRYGALTAIDSLDFEVKKGEIVGFLGRNGAGKSTTMRILTGSLGATSGKATIGGFDVFERPKDVKRLVGYLPEVPPLYGDMTVSGYLKYAARLKGVKDPKAAVARVIGQVGLSDVAHRLIEHLSKGYRQRVGIAQALVHEPKVLVLDEPVSGLDPAQRKDILDLVVGLAAGETTVVLSTHVLAEIEPVCKRVIIVHRGKIVASDTVDALAEVGRRVALRVARPDAGLVDRLRQIEGVSSVETHEPGALTVIGDRDIREQVGKIGVEAGLLELKASQGLQEVFLRLTGDA